MLPIVLTTSFHLVIVVAITKDNIRIIFFLVALDLVIITKTLLLR